LKLYQYGTWRSAMILISKEVSALDFISSFAYGQHGMKIRL
jgi:hypothetical protein